jgi:hypothetical protein
MTSRADVRYALRHWHTRTAVSTLLVPNLLKLCPDLQSGSTTTAEAVMQPELKCTQVGINMQQTRSITTCLKPNFI